MVSAAIVILSIIIVILVILLIVGGVYIYDLDHGPSGPTGCTGCNCPGGPTGCTGPSGYNYMLGPTSSVWDFGTPVSCPNQTLDSPYCIVPASTAPSLCQSISGCIGYLVRDGSWIGHSGTPLAQLVQVTPQPANGNTAPLYGIYFMQQPN